MSETPTPLPLDPELIHDLSDRQLLEMLFMSVAVLQSQVAEMYASYADARPALAKVTAEIQEQGIMGLMGAMTAGLMRR